MNPGVAGGMVGGALGLASSAAQMAMTKRAQQRQIDASRYNYKHRYQWMIDDLQAANLSPILAISQGAGSAPQAGGAGSFATPDPVGSAARGLSSALEVKLTKKELDRKQAETDKLEAEAGRTKVQAGLDYMSFLGAGYGLPEKRREADFYSDARGKDAVERREAAKGKPFIPATMEWVSELISQGLMQGIDWTNSRDRDRGTFSPKREPAAVEDRHRYNWRRD